MTIEGGAPTGWARFVWLNGQVLSAEKARISVFDRGMLLGDGVYETLRARRGRIFRWPPHRDRLERSLAGARIALPCPLADLETGILQCLEANALEDARIRLTVTRGLGDPGFDLMPGSFPTVVIAASSWKPIAEERYREGVPAVVSRIHQTGREDLDPFLKSISRIHLVLARMEAGERGAFEAILLGADGELREGTASNLFLAKEGRLRTPSVECGILEGVTREAVLEAARAAGRPCEETRLTRADLESADEIFFTNTSWGALPVSRLEGKPVGDGRPGPLAAAARKHLDSLVEKECSE